MAALHCCDHGIGRRAVDADYLRPCRLLHVHVVVRPAAGKRAIRLHPGDPRAMEPRAWPRVRELRDGGNHLARSMIVSWRKVTDLADSSTQQHLPDPWSTGYPTTISPTCCS